MAIAGASTLPQENHLGCTIDIALTHFHDLFHTYFKLATTV